MIKIKKGNKPRHAAQKIATNKVSKIGESLHACNSGMIAEAVYYKAEKRGFVLGYEAQDWLEAEEELQSSNKGYLSQDLG